MKEKQQRNEGKHTIGEMICMTIVAVVTVIFIIVVNLKDAQTQTVESLLTTTSVSIDEETSNESYSIEQVTLWAQAFCNRDGAAIRAMASDEVITELEEQEWLSGDSFGVSSPWPWDDSDYVVTEITDNTCTILYYAETSDPHVTVICEHLTFQIETTHSDMDEQFFLVTKEEFIYLDQIATMEEFIMAYPEGSFKNTMLDYTTNEMGQALNDNALLSSSNAYLPLFKPETASVMLLNLSEDESKVQTVTNDYGDEELARVTITFLEDGSQVEVLMSQPYGSIGIWIPVEYRVL